MRIHHFFIRVTGRVQGVGFRPFIYRLASDLKLSGNVCNTAGGVLINIYSDKKTLNGFILKIKTSPPPLAVIRDVSIEDLGPKPLGPDSFTIIESKEGGKNEIDVTPDTGTCENCFKELGDINNRRFEHPFINCTDCGPRYTIIKTLPYDRPGTTMAGFTLCPECRKEYQEPGNRRFHAQPVCCHDCGPVLEIVNNRGERNNCDDPVMAACRYIDEGKIIAVKGIGGYHLTCRADSQEIVNRLRKRKKREAKPFAIMVDSLKTARQICHLSGMEDKILQAFQKPILLAKKKDDSPIKIANNVAPSVTTHGIMLPYTPIHKLLFKKGGYKTLIMTSANITDEPIIHENAVSKLKQIADFFLTHNRDIFIRIDDSIIRLLNHKPVFLRRARGYIPEPIPSPSVPEQINVDGIIALGGILKSTITVGRGNQCYMSQYLGTLDDLETLKYMRETTRHLMDILKVKPKIYAADKHPLALTKKLIPEKNVKIQSIQHHHAHAVSCMAENNLKGRCIAVVYDGTGYGDDNTIWGGEILLAGYRDFIRMAHLRKMVLPGGDMAVLEPWRTAIGLLFDEMGEECLNFFPDIQMEKKKAVLELIQTQTSCPVTTSMGRLFDTLSAVLGICLKQTYEGQPAIELEAASNPDEHESYPFALSLDEHRHLVIDGMSIFIHAVNDLKEGLSKDIIAARFHHTICSATVQAVHRISRGTGINQVCLSGGCFQNRLLLERTENMLKKLGLNCYTHRLVSPNDEGISYGQAIIAGALIKN
jgi:hydrogenase maturation protein HypF